MIDLPLHVIEHPAVPAGTLYTVSVVTDENGEPRISPGATVNVAAPQPPPVEEMPLPDPPAPLVTPTGTPAYGPLVFARPPELPNVAEQPMPDWTRPPPLAVLSEQDVEQLARTLEVARIWVEAGGRQADMAASRRPDLLDRAAGALNELEQLADSARDLDMGQLAGRLDADCEWLECRRSELERAQPHRPTESAPVTAPALNRDAMSAEEAQALDEWAGPFDLHRPRHRP